MQQHRAQIFDEQRKRPAPTEPTDGLDPAKRQRLDASLSTPTPPGEQIGDASGPGPMSLAQIFTLTSDPNLINDISSIAKPVVDQLIVPLMRSVDRQRLDVAINVCLPFLFTTLSSSFHSSRHENFATVVFHVSHC